VIYSYNKSQQDELILIFI